MEGIEEPAAILSWLQGNVAKRRFPDILHLQHTASFKPFTGIENFGCLEYKGDGALRMTLDGAWVEHQFQSCAIGHEASDMKHKSDMAL